MNRMRSAGWAFVALVGWTVPGHAMFLDDARLFKLTALFYTQERLAIQDSEGPPTIFGGGTQPMVQMGQAIQLRNYAFPVLEGNLAKFLGADAFLKDFSFRFGGRFVYDGIYDIGTDQFRESLRRYQVEAENRRIKDSDAALGGLGTVGQPAPIWEGTKPVEALDGSLRPCGTPPAISPICRAGNANQRAARVRNEDLFNPRNQFDQQQDPWEIYLNVAKGPVFVRIGRQNLSWGESDGQRLLDEINPLNRFFGLPFDEDLDEQRIPLWMVRSNVQLISSLGPLSSFGLEGFWVPGVIDTTQSPFNTSGNNPYGPPSGCDPQMVADVNTHVKFGGSQPIPGCNQGTGGFLPDGTIKTQLYNRLPSKNINNSRFGLRVLGVLFRDYTVSLGAYQTYQDAPVPRVHYLDILNVPVIPNFPNTPPLPSTVIAELVHHKETIVGGTISFFQPRVLPGVVRSEVGYFHDEAVTVNIANRGFVPDLQEFAAGGRPFFDTYVPKADFLRWVVGYDIFQLNIPIISRTNNVVLVNQWFAELNLSGTAKERNILAHSAPPSIASSGTTTPGDASPDNAAYTFGLAQPDGSVTKIPKFNSLGNNTLQAFMMHGLLVPQLTFVWSPQGWFSLLPNVTYRIRDDLLVRVGYSGIYGSFYAGGFFRDRDQIGIRLSYLIS